MLPCRWKSVSIGSGKVLIPADRARNGKFESTSLQRRVACELDITGSAIDVRSRLKLTAFIDDSEEDVLSYLDFET